MKALSLPSLALTALLLAASPAMAQTPETPAAPTAPAEKAKPLGSAERSFAKNALEGVYTLLQYSDKNRVGSLKMADAKALATKINSDLNKLWGELGPLSSGSGDKLPDALSTSDKSKLEKLNKGPVDKFDKEWLKLITKETGHLSSLFTAASRLSDPQIKPLVATWQISLKALDEEADKLEKIAAKAK